MRIIPILSIVTLLAPAAFAQQPSRTYVGIVTDTMCGTDHTAMKVAPDTRCVRDCVGDGRTYRYALSDGTYVYTLSDQRTPATFAGLKVKVTGVLYAKTNILKVERIERAQ